MGPGCVGHSYGVDWLHWSQRYQSIGRVSTIRGAVTPHCGHVQDNDKLSLVFSALVLQALLEPGLNAPIFVAGVFDDS
ncbi:MAG: hypothetical protein J07HX5_02105 [halophilic archaeon J07HX5]|nr:MAG: hypothetical protein J07HX5_02105 [halophilic archaeon J07HX5]